MRTRCQSRCALRRRLRLARKASFCRARIMLRNIILLGRRPMPCRAGLVVWGRFATSCPLRSTLALGRGPHGCQTVSLPCMSFSAPARAHTVKVRVIMYCSNGLSDNGSVASLTSQKKQSLTARNLFHLLIACTPAGHVHQSQREYEGKVQVARRPERRRTMSI